MLLSGVLVIGVEEEEEKGARVRGGGGGENRGTDLSGMMVSSQGTEQLSPP